MPKREKIQEMFDNIAPEYDRLNHIMSLDVDKTWRKRALTQIFKQTVGEPELEAEGCGMKVLDIACGTGDFSIAIAEEMVRRAKRCHQQGTDPSCCHGHVTGLDLSSGMLEIMGKKVEAKGLQDLISYEVGDCEHLRFEDGAFDRVTVAFGVRNFENREACLKEMLRVLRPGGELVILELSVPSNFLMRWAYNLYFLNILPIIGGKVSGDSAAYRYLPASVLNFPKKQLFMNTLRVCGYRNVRHKAFTFGICRMYSGEK